MKNHLDPDVPSETTKLNLELFITCETDAIVTIEIKNIGFKETLKVPKGTVRNVKLDPMAQIKSSEIVEQQAAVHITSDQPISVYGLNSRSATTDSFRGLPVNVIGTNYRVMCYNFNNEQLSQLAIVAGENDTKISINPTVTTVNGRKPKEVFSVVLNKGDVYQVRGKSDLLSQRKSDLTGSLISANKPISVFSGHQCAYIPDTLLACNHLVEQIPSIDSWGKHYYLGALKKRSNYTYRVLANTDDTKIFINAQLTKTLNAGEYIEKTSSKSIQVTSDKPILVAQYSQGYMNGDAIGDPMMMLISPTQQFLKKYRFATPISGSWEHFINVIASQEAINKIKLDGKILDSTKFEQIANSRYYLSQQKVNYGTHEIESDKPFGMSSYGFGIGDGHRDAYGTIGGQSFTEFVQAKDVLAPLFEYDIAKKRLVITVRDDRNDDSGIKYINVESNNNLKIEPFKYSEGAPEATLTITPQIDNQQGQLLLKASDMEGNVTYISICYNLNRYKGIFDYFVNEGNNVICQEVETMIYSGFFRYSKSLQYADFTETGNFKAKPGAIQSQFHSISGTSGYFGIGVGKRIIPHLVATASLTLENIGGDISTQGKSIYYDSITKSNAYFSESRTIHLNGLLMGLNINAEWQFKQFFYGIFGLNLKYLMSKSVDITDRVQNPIEYSYNSTGAKTQKEDLSELSSLKSIGIGYNFGLGFQHTVYRNISVFLETTYSQRLNSLIDDGNWNVNNLNFLFGAKIKL